MPEESSSPSIIVKKAGAGVHHFLYLKVMNISYLQESLHDSLYQCATVQFHRRQKAGGLCLVEAETQQVALLEIEVFEVTAELLLATFVVGVAAPDLQFYHVLFAQIVNDHVHAVQVTRLLFDVITAYTIDNRAQIGQENPATVLLEEPVILIHVEGLVHVDTKTLQEVLHVDDAIVDELRLRHLPQQEGF